MGSGKLLSGIKEYFSSDLKVKLIVLLGLAGMILILLGQLFGGSGKDEEPPVIDSTTAQFTSAEYAQQLEDKLQGLVTEIDGVGRAEVMVTLETGVEYVYALEEKRNTDRSSDATGPDEERLSQRENVEQTYLLVDGDSGKEPLIRMELQPRVQGVVIVCDGADDPRVEQNLISVVTTALGVSSTRVCVVKISESDILQEEAE